MRKGFVSALMMTLLLLTGCGRREAKLENEFAAFRENLRAAQSIEAQVSLSCDSGDVVSQYGLRLSWNEDETRITVTEPELIAGISAVVTDGGARVEYEGVMLGVGELAGLTPVSALPEMLKAMAYGYEELLWREDDYLAARLWLDEESVMTLWLSEGVPVCTEISAAGQTVMTCRFESWQMS